jgi:hypothetical protein
MTNLKKMNLTLTTLTLSALLLACGGEEAQDLTRDESLESLGVNTKLGDRKDADGKAVLPSYHPLTKKHSALAPLSELYFAGLDHNTKLQGLLDDAKDGALAELHSDSDGSWAKLPLAASKGDIDGAGYDEIVVVYYHAKDKALKLKTIDRVSGQYVSSTITAVKDVTLDTKVYSSDYFIANSMALTTGDLDGDGRDELALAFTKTLYILDDASKQHAGLAAKTYASAGTASSPLSALRLGVGDFYGDGKERLFVTRTEIDAKGSGAYADYYLYEGALAQELASGQLMIRDGYKTHMVMTANLAVGDIDGDKLDEVVFTGIINNAPHLFVMDDQRNKGEFLNVMQPLSFSPMGLNPFDIYFLPVALLDMDADGVKEIAVSNQLLEYDANAGKLASLATLGFNVPRAHTVGDLDGDLREDLIATIGSVITVWGTEASGAFKQLKTLAVKPASLSPALVAANTDDDSLIVEYTGKQELLFSDPQVVAVMAAAPSYSGIGQQDGSTTFGKTKGTEAETSASLGVAVSASIGAKAGFKFFGNGVEVEAKQTFSASMNATATAAVSISTSYAFTGGGDEDKVVFTAVPFDVYYYKVLSSPDASAVGQVISINLPRKPQTFSVSRSYYNAHNGEAPDVDTETLSHSIGDPWSYPTRSDRDQHLTNGLALLKQGWVNASNPTLGGWVNDTMVTVGQGSGEQTLTIEASRSIGAGVEVELSSTTEVEATVGPVVAGGSLEFSVGVGLNVTVGEGFFVEGTIGDIPADHFSGDKLYKAGLYAYPHQAKGGQSFMVVNYWVEK